MENPVLLGWINEARCTIQLHARRRDIWQKMMTTIIVYYIEAIAKDFYINITAVL